MTQACIDGGSVQIATVWTKGQVVIPHKMREQFGIQSGDQILFLSKDDGFISLIKVDNMQHMLDQMQEFLNQTT
jgi:AbrB family looped-hinge helix DNA binding protein